MQCDCPVESVWTMPSRPTVEAPGGTAPGQWIDLICAFHCYGDLVFAMLQAADLHWLDHIYVLVIKAAFLHLMQCDGELLACSLTPLARPSTLP